MRRAAALAKRAEGYTSPNPLVGCVVVKGNKIIGEGWHHEAGKAHAEVEALNSVKSGAGDSGTIGATMYVTLEPCCHTGRTNPCTDAIIAAGIETVVFAVSDPNPVAGGGREILEQAGVKTITGVLEQECSQLNRFYLHYQLTRRPFVIAKFASSLDGKIATHTGQSQWITGAVARSRAHLLRHSVDAILIGAQTAIDDDPKLTTRLPEENAGPPSHPLRVVLDGNARVPMNRKIYSGTLPGNTLVATSEHMSTDQENELKSRGIDVERFSTTKDNRQIPLPSLMDTLGQSNIQSLMVEGGQSVLGAFNDAQLINEIWAFVAPKIIGGEHSTSAVGGLGIATLDSAGVMDSVELEQLPPDILIRGKLTYPKECS